MTYREALLNAASKLDFFMEGLLSNLFEVAMTGELKEWAETVPNGESHTLGMDLFSALDDINAKALVRLYKAIENSYDHFTNVNAIKVEEIEQFRDKMLTDMWDEGDPSDENIDENSLDNELPF